MGMPLCAPHIQPRALPPTLFQPWLGARRYAVVIKRASKTYEIFIDGSSVKAGSLDTDFSPPFQPPTEIDDPEDFKPDDWVDEAQIPDPDATKPDDWDEDAPREIPDADAEKPSGWLDDEADYIADP